MRSTKKSQSKARRPSLKGTNAKLVREVKELRRERDEALEQQTATSEVLRVIAGSPTELQPVLDAVAENAARLIGAHDAVIHRLDGEVLRDAAHYGLIPRSVDATRTPVNRGSVAGRAVVDRQTVHVYDMQAETDAEFPVAKPRAARDQTRSVLGTPLLREGVPIGTILIRRTEVRPFTDKQIKLLETFADQAVIAIENVRLFQELQARNRDLTEALEQQTATSEILRVIASSPTDLQPVLDVVAENAARLCDASDAQIMRVEGNMLRLVASYGSIPIFSRDEERSITRGLAGGRAVIDRETIHIHDVCSPEGQAEFPEGWAFSHPIGVRTVLATPLLREGVAIGTILIRRSEVRPFTDNQIALLKTFADQAVIAIENVRLFQELQARNGDLTEALEQQTATSEILRVIASSPTDLQPVLDAVAESAARLCEANDALIHRIDGDTLKRVANFGPLPARLGGGPPSIDRGYIPGRAVIERQTIHIHDLAEEPEHDLAAPFARRIGVRTVLATPLLREGVPIGSIMIRRTEVRPFTDSQIKL
ncbi:MAG: GAF domain-containing protein, partial [bacterium]